jgi:hypothetical protein
VFVSQGVHVAVARQLSARTLDALTREASFVFQGRVDSIGAHNLESGVEVEDRMAVVQVEDVVVAPASLGDLTGQKVTVHLQSTTGIEPKQSLTFFATSWHYGANIGVIEVGRTSTPASELRRRVVDQRLEAQHDLLEARIRRAILIISGRVEVTFRTKLTGLPGEDEGTEWWEAETWIRSVEKGTPPPNLTIVFPVGGDREWGPVPKAQAGQDGVWLLGPVTEPDSEDEDKPSIDREGLLMALDPLDYQAISALPLVQELLRRAQG